MLKGHDDVWLSSCRAIPPQHFASAFRSLHLGFASLISAALHIHQPHVHNPMCPSAPKGRRDRGSCHHAARGCDVYSQTDEEGQGRQQRRPSCDERVKSSEKFGAAWMQEYNEGNGSDVMEDGREPYACMH